MAFYIFDYDGTIADVRHRRHLLDNRQWDAFFDACDQDPPFPDTIAILKDLISLGHRVEIWSGRSAAVEQKSRDWLVGQGVDPSILKRMRPVGDFTPDEKLKRAWLHEERALGNEPIAIFDDRMKVVVMWRAEGVPCYQVNAGDFDSPQRVNPNYIYTDGEVPLFTILIGPSGAGKTTLAREKFDPQTVISADMVRKHLTGSFKDQSRNKDVWTAIKLLIQTRLAVGLPTVLDATNVRRADRVGLVALADQHVRVAYLVVERDLASMMRTGDHRLDVFKAMGKDGTKKTIIERHDQVFRSNLKDILKGDGLPNVEVYQGWDAYEKALTTRASAYFESDAFKTRSEEAAEA